MDRNGPLDESAPENHATLQTAHAERPSTHITWEHIASLTRRPVWMCAHAALNDSDARGHTVKEIWAMIGARYPEITTNRQRTTLQHLLSTSRDFKGYMDENSDLMLYSLTGSTEGVPRGKPKQPVEAPTYHHSESENKSRRRLTPTTRVARASSSRSRLVTMSQVDIHPHPMPIGLGHSHGASISSLLLADPEPPPSTTMFIATTPPTYGTDPSNEHSSNVPPYLPGQNQAAIGPMGGPTTHPFHPLPPGSAPVLDATVWPLPWLSNPANVSPSFHNPGRPGDNQPNLYPLPHLPPNAILPALLTHSRPISSTPQYSLPRNAATRGQAREARQSRFTPYPANLGSQHQLVAQPLQPLLPSLNHTSPPNQLPNPAATIDSIPMHHSISWAANNTLLGGHALPLSPARTAVFNDVTNVGAGAGTLSDLTDGKHMHDPWEHHFCRGTGLGRPDMK
ncbi:hypothetical protein FRB99_001534 [Tulasnella sp. 403]|nr:hypothetical protein FRB99_001534 [Tulasnella sp. 403]